MKKVFKGLLPLSIVIGFLFIGNNLMAQGPPGGGGGPGQQGCVPPPCVPIDGGLSILLIAGAAYGSKKIYDQRH